MGSHADALETLELFNEKADELLSSRFFDEARGGGAIVEFRRGSGWDSLFVGPDDESTKALVLTLRLFMQNNSRISLQDLEALYRAFPLSAGLMGRFAERRAELNAFLDSESRLSISEDGPLSYREILATFVYGTYAHVSAEQRQTYEGIRTTAFYPLFQATLIDAFVAVGRCVAALRQINDAAAAELRRARS